MSCNELSEMSLVLLNIGDPDSILIASIVEETATNVSVNRPIVIKTTYDIRSRTVGAYANRYMGFSEGPIHIRKDSIISFAKPAEHLAEFYKMFLQEYTDEEALCYELQILNAVYPTPSASNEAESTEHYSIDKSSIH